MNPVTAEPQPTAPSPAPANPPQFTHRLELRPLGYLYGSTGPFLSPDSLVGKAGRHFPPHAMTLAGLVATTVADADQLKSYQFAGPFWAWNRQPANIYVPTPLNCLVKHQQIQHQMAWHQERQQWQAWIEGQWQTPEDGKHHQTGTWLDIETWAQLDPTQPRSLTVTTAPWQFTPHLHPKLQLDQRKTVAENGLFLESAVQLHPDACLVYLCNHAVAEGWYRFGGEGHLVDLTCHEIKGTPLATLLNRPCDRAFATITPAVWGSNRRSLRSPLTANDNITPVWPRGEEPNPGNAIGITALLTGKPLPQRHRIGKPVPQHRPPDIRESPSLLSRGRHALPAGTVYVLDEGLGRSWQDWPLSWFPTEGYSYKRFGSGLALPLNVLV